MAKSPYQRLKATTWRWCSRYVRVRDSINYARQYGLALDSMFCKCYTCGHVHDIRDMDAGHYRSRGHGGHSGIYFETDALRTQCTRCNTYNAGMPDEFRANLIKEYGEDIIEKLLTAHKIKGYKMTELAVLKEYFRTEVNQMCEETGIVKWWLK